MKRLSFLLVLIIFLQACSSHVEKKYVIVQPAHADTTVVHAARQLQNYWEKITGRRIAIIHHTPRKRTGIFLGHQMILPAYNDSVRKLKKDGFLIAINKKGIFLEGKTGLSTLYAVNTFLEEKLGCIKLSSTEDYIPHHDSIRLVPGFKKYNPAFDFRCVYFPGGRNPAYRQWYKLNWINVFGMYVHTFNKLIPPKIYFKEHPEYFSLVNGRRMEDGQLCLSNPAVIKLLIKNLRDTINKKPDKKYWSVSQNDEYNYCECPKCQKLYKKYGAVSGAYIAAVNKVAKAFPDKIISTLAYQFTRKAPTGIKPDSNVNIMLCTIECSRSKPLDQMDGPHSFFHDLKDWSHLTHNIYLWNYVVQFKNYLCPFPNFPVLQPNLQLFKKYGVQMVFEQGSGRNWSDLMELKQYLLSKLEWNPDANVDSLVHVFVHAYYGNAAKYILDYYYTMNRVMQQHKNDQFLNIYGFPSDYTGSFLSPHLMNYYEAVMDSAEQAVAGNPVLLRRVKRTRLSVDFAWVDIAVNSHFKQMPAIIDSSGKKVINPKIIRLLNRMEQVAESDPRISVRERHFSVSDYKNYVLNNLRREIMPNKLAQATVTLETKPSPKYPVGGAKALTDNLMGALDFHHNWLGFEGDDMIADFYFKKPVTLSHIEMNFLKAINSWVFLPVNVKIEVSNDGKHYRLLQEKKGDNSDHHFLVKSVPFNFRFSPVKVRYLRVVATSMKTCPQWHRGYGNPSWIFTDEIIGN